MTCTSRSLYELPNRKLPRFKVKLRLVKRVYRLPFALPELKQEQAQTRSPAHRFLCSHLENSGPEVSSRLHLLVRRNARQESGARSG